MGVAVSGFVSVAQVAADADEGKAYLAEARLLVDETKSTIYDILTGEHDRWARGQIIALLDAIDDRVKRAAK